MIYDVRGTGIDTHTHTYVRIIDVGLDVTTTDLELLDMRLTSEALTCVSFVPGYASGSGILVLVEVACRHGVVCSCAN